MAGTYNPQIVGSHFVKQYYTQLHKDPVQLHRFYLDQSSYVHGSSEIGSEEAVVGQKAIHEKILSINFKSVHAKIKQVDSHATLGEGIVIQVTGELSVNGQPMRAFVQTFVLAPESPKKYYVHNDIFRYQDDAYDITSESENNEGMTEREQDVVQVQPADLYQTSQPSQQPQQQQQLTEVDITLRNGNRRSSAEQSPPGKEPWTQYNDVGGHAESVSSDTSTPLEMLPPQPSESPETTYKANESDTGLQTEDVRMTTPVGGNQDYPAEEEKGGQLSWASRISQATGATITKSQPPATNQVIQPPPPPPPQQQQTPPSQPQVEVRKKPSSENLSIPANRSGGVVGSGGGGGFGNQDPSRRPNRSIPDTYQLFVGGLPPSTTEQELRSVFETYGRILEIRNNPNNFAFLVFDSEKPVKSILQKKDREPPKIRGKQLNIEKKKASEAVRARTGFRRDAPLGAANQRGGPRGAPKNSKR